MSATLHRSTMQIANRVHDQHFVNMNGSEDFVLILHTLFRSIVSFSTRASEKKLTLKLKNVGYKKVSKINCADKRNQLTPDNYWLFSLNNDQIFICFVFSLSNKIMLQQLCAQIFLYNLKLFSCNPFYVRFHHCSVPIERMLSNAIKRSIRKTLTYYYSALN